MSAKKRKKANAYVPEALDSFAKDLSRIRIPSKSVNVPKSQVIPENIPEALNALSKEDRESIERYWGLTGAVNHSKRIGHHNTKDRALMDMQNRAVEALKKMSKLEIARIYDASVDRMIDMVSKKVDKDGVAHISDFESIKYLMAFLIIVENGPKLPLEEEPMKVDNTVDTRCYLDEYEALREMCEELEELTDKSISLSLIKSLFEMMDLKDYIAIRENFEIGSWEIFHPNELEVLKSLGSEVSEITSSKNIQEIMTFGSVRDFKERVFKYGPWEVTTKIIEGQTVEMEEFIEEVGTICKSRDWVAKIETFKIDETKRIKTSKEVRTLNIYRIGGLEFTDPCEIDFLRLHLTVA